MTGTCVEMIIFFFLRAWENKLMNFKLKKIKHPNQFFFLKKKTGIKRCKKKKKEKKKKFNKEIDDRKNHNRVHQ